jgi:hypothetical protein
MDCGLAETGPAVRLARLSLGTRHDGDGRVEASLKVQQGGSSKGGAGDYSRAIWRILSTGRPILSHVFMEDGCENSAPVSRTPVARFRGEG